MVKKKAAAAPKAEPKKPPTRERGRPPVDDSKKLTEKFLASFTKTDFSEIKNFEQEENVNEHSEATRRLVRLGLRLRRMLKEGKISFSDLQD